MEIPLIELNIYSAVAAAAAAVALFFLALQRGGMRRSVAAVGAIILMLSGALAANARASEVFALNALFLVGILYAAIDRRWLLAFFLTGLGAGNHQIVLFVLPALALTFWLDKMPAAKAPAKHVVSWFFLSGLLIYAVLLLRAQKSTLSRCGTSAKFGTLVARHASRRLWQLDVGVGGNA